MILGTAAYMSPEQARGKAVDRRTDIWSFGCVLYECLTAKLAFEGETVSDIVARILRGSPIGARFRREPPTRARTAPALPRTRQQAPAARYRRSADRNRERDRAAPNAARLVGSPGECAHRCRSDRQCLGWWRRRSRSRWRSWPGRPGASAPLPSTPLRLSVELESERHPVATTDAATGGRPRWSVSPDGRLLVFVGQTGAGTRLIHVRRLEQALASTPLPGTEGASHPFLSPDSRWIGFFADNKLKKVAIEGGPTVTLCDAVVDNRGGSWSPDGTILFAVAGEPTLRRISAGGGAVTELPTSGEAAAAVDARWPQILPGGRAVIFTSGVSGNYDAASLVVQRLPDGPRKIVHKGGYQGRYVRSGHLLYMRGGALFAAPFDLERLEIVGASMPVLEGVASNPGAGGAQFAASDSGALVFLSGGSQVPPMPIAWLGRDGQARPLRPTPAIYFVIGFSPDGQRLAMDIRDR